MALGLPRILGAKYSNWRCIDDFGLAHSRIGAFKRKIIGCIEHSSSICTRMDAIKWNSYANFLNGKPQETSCQNLLQLIQELSLEGKRYAVEMNELIISK